MADSVLKSYLISLGFATTGGSEFKRSLKDYEKAVVDAEKAIEDARWAGAKTQEEIAKLTRETNLKLAREALAKAADAKKQEDELAKKRKEDAAALIKGFEKLAIAAAAAATAIGYALSKISGAFDNLYFQAERAGTSVQSLKAIGYAFSQTGGSAQQAQASVDSFTTKIRNNPGLRQFVKDLGVNDRLQGVDKYIATLDAIKKRTADQPGVGAQYAEMLGISEENYNQWLRQGEAIKAYDAQYKGLLKTFGLDTEKAADNSVKFERAMGKLRATVSILAEKLLTALAPAITKIVDRFQAWVEANPGALDKILNNIATAIIAVAEGIAKFIASITGDDGDGFIRRWDAFTVRVVKFAEAIERIVYGVERLLKMLHLISGTNTVLGSSERTISALNSLSGGTVAPNGPGGANEAKKGASGQPPADGRSWLQKRLPTWLGGKDAPEGAGGSGGGKDAPGTTGGQYTSEPPGAAGTYRPQRTLTERDLDDKVINTIAGEARLKTPGGADAVINNMFNRLGSKGWGPSGDLHDVARAPGQYEGYRQATPGEAAHIRERIKAIASGGVPDNTNGSNSFRASWYRGPWYQKHGRNGKDVGGNTFAYDPSIKNGPYAPYPKPKANEAGDVSLKTPSDAQREKVSIDDFLGEMQKDPKYQKEAADSRQRYKDQTDGPRAGENFYDFYRRRATSGMGRGEGETGRNSTFGSAKGLTEELNRSAKRAREEKGLDGSTYEERLERGVGSRAKARSEFTPDRELTLDEIRAFTRPSTPAGIGPGSTSNSSDSRSVNQNINNNVSVTGVERPGDHAKAVQSTLRNVHQMSLENAQSAIA